ncbi:MAG: STAS-like domain-containing protein [Cyanobacteria bacterium P01_A01_bin.123]
MKLQICAITGEYATDADSGQQIYEAIHPQLLAGEAVELDFTTVNVFASAFFNFAIGQLLQDLSPDTLNHQLKIEGLSPHGYSILKRVIDNAKHYYADAQYQAAVDTVMEEYAASF